jgi:uncharacterized protein DUF4424
MSRFALCALCVCLASAARADIAPDPVPRYGETIAPRQETHVALREETVTITLGPDEASVRASFTLVNEGSSAERLEVGFPTAAQMVGGTVDEKGVHVTEWGPARLHDLRVRIDGVAVKTESRDGSIGPSGISGWALWNMTFAPRSTRTVTVSYDVPTVDRYRDPESYLRNRQLTYILTTGRGWAGPIGRATIVVQAGAGITPEHIVSAAPQPATKEELRWTWVMKNFEPTADVVVKYRVFRDARHAIDKLWRDVRALQATVDDTLTYAQSLEAVGDDLGAAYTWAQVSRHFERPFIGRKEGAMLSVTSWGAFHGPRPYVPPALRAARLADKSGDARARAQFAREALDRIDNLESLSAVQSEWFLQKAYGIDDETLKVYRAECLQWIKEK